MNTLWQNWTLFRIIRLALGLIILVQGIISRELPSILMGLIFSGLALINAGCCGTGGCSTGSDIHKKQQIPEDVEYEEVVAEK